MASNVFGAKQFKPTAPDKGSFPLDHDGECKKPYLQFMICLAENGNKNSLCREESKGYLDCRMNKGLMTKESFSRLGFSDLEKGDGKTK
jgi:cytochrome c oxidase assembly protein subunit 19